MKLYVGPSLPWGQLGPLPSRSLTLRLALSDLWCCCHTVTEAAAAWSQGNVCAHACREGAKAAEDRHTGETAPGSQAAAGDAQGRPQLRHHCGAGTSHSEHTAAHLHNHVPCAGRHHPEVSQRLAAPNPEIVRRQIWWSPVSGSGFCSALADVAEWAVN